MHTHVSQLHFWVHSAALIQITSSCYFTAIPGSDPTSLVLRPGGEPPRVLGVAETGR